MDDREARARFLELSDKQYKLLGEELNLMDDKKKRLNEQYGQMGKKKDCHEEYEQKQKLWDEEYAHLMEKYELWKDEYKQRIHGIPRAGPPNQSVPAAPPVAPKPKITVHCGGESFHLDREIFTKDSEVARRALQDTNEWRFPGWASASVFGRYVEVLYAMAVNPMFNAESCRRPGVLANSSLVVVAEQLKNAPMMRFALDSLRDVLSTFPVRMKQTYRIGTELELQDMLEYHQDQCIVDGSQSVENEFVAAYARCAPEVVKLCQEWLKPRLKAQAANEHHLYWAPRMREQSCQARDDHAFLSRLSSEDATEEEIDKSVDLVMNGVVEWVMGKIGNKTDQAVDRAIHRRGRQARFTRTTTTKAGLPAKGLRWNIIKLWRQ